jgi:hypothetical protein
MGNIICPGVMTVCFSAFSSIASGYKNVEKIRAMNAEVLYRIYAVLCCM